MPWTDSHCHVPWEGLDEPTAVVEAARAAGVTRMVTVGTDAAQSAAAIKVAREHEGVWATVGLHPHDARHGASSIEGLLHDEVVVAVGECGLDYHYDNSPRDIQRDAFAEQIRMANARDLALVIHTRDAWDDTFAVLADEGVPARTVFHCFTGGAREADRALAIGAYLSFSGIVTFKTADDVRAAAAVCPLERMLVETDSPYLAPVPHRGRPNTPGLVPLVGAHLALLKGIEVGEVERATWQAAETVFRLRASEGLP